MHYNKDINRNGNLTTSKSFRKEDITFRTPRKSSAEFVPKVRGVEPVSSELIIKNMNINKDCEDVLSSRIIAMPILSDHNFTLSFIFSEPKPLILKSLEKVIYYTNVKVYMPKAEILVLCTGIKTEYVTPDYYNSDNGGNIAIVLMNTTKDTITIEPNDKIATGFFITSLPIDNTYI